MDGAVKNEVRVYWRILWAGGFVRTRDAPVNARAALFWHWRMIIGLNDSQQAPYNQTLDPPSPRHEPLRHPLQLFVTVNIVVYPISPPFIASGVPSQFRALPPSQELQ